MELYAKEENVSTFEGKRLSIFNKTSRRFPQNVLLHMWQHFRLFHLNHQIS